MGALHAMLLDELGYDPDDPEDVALEELSPVAVGEVVRARRGVQPVAVARLTSGKLVVVDDVCPHDGGRISDGYVEGERIVCARHGWELEIVGGRCRRAGPCKLRE